MNNKKQMSIRRALKNPRTRRRIGGTMETLPGEFADPGAARIEALRRIVRDHQYEKIDGQMVDGFTASAIVQVYDALNEANRAKYRAMTVPKMASVAWKFVKNPAHRERAIARANLTVPEKHQLRIARDTLKMSDVGANIMGGPTKDEAREIIFRLTGEIPRENPAHRELAIARAGVTDKKYLSRPSQLSRTTPSKRLRSRRSVNLSAGREGFFPNPGGGAWRVIINNRDSGMVETNYNYAVKHWAERAKRTGTKIRLEPVADIEQNPTRKSRSLVSLTGAHSGKVYGFAEESDLRLDNTGTLRRAALALANKHREPIRFERVSVTTLSPRMRENPSERERAIARRGLDTLYAETSHRGYSTWTYSDGERVKVRDFATLEGLQQWAKKNRYGIVYVNPAPRADRIAAASRRFTRFTGHRAANVRNLPFPDNPGAALAVGPVLVLGYSATRDGKTENYLHKFTRHAAPLLAASHDGNSLYLLGGKYRFAERGIVDLKPR